MELYLKITTGKQSASLCVSTGHSVTFGRSRASDIVIKNEMMSKVHLFIKLDEYGTLHWQDMKSTNGTKANDKYLQAGKLFLGDRLTIGETTIILTRKGMTPEMVQNFKRKFLKKSFRKNDISLCSKKSAKNLLIRFRMLARGVRGQEDGPKMAASMMREFTEPSISIN